ncbi:MAG: HIT family protein [bacterium]|nr:HIT family protein [bacterium]
MEITEEQLKQMSPEEINELQKQNCIFCHIASGKAPAKKIYEDPDCIGVLDINPANPGHVLLFPKEHYMIMSHMPDNAVGRLASVSKAVSQAVLRTLKAQGTTIFIANGVVAGQRAPHFMIHIIPRMDADGLPLELPENKITDSELHELQKKMGSPLKKLMGVKEEPISLDKKPKKKEKKEPKKKEEKKQKKEKKKKEVPKKDEKIDLDEISDLLG